MILSSNEYRLIWKFLDKINPRSIHTPSRYVVGAIREKIRIAAGVTHYQYKGEVNCFLGRCSADSVTYWGYVTCPVCRVNYL